MRPAARVQRLQRFPDRAATAFVGTGVSEVRHKGLAEIARAAAVRGRHGLVEVVPEGKLDLLMASPTCTYHSRARGGKPISDQGRMDPWAIVHWCTELRVRRLLVENVPEFVDWGPLDLRTGRPIKRRHGEYFRAWIAALQGAGFKLDWRVLNAADLATRRHASVSF